MFLGDKQSCYLVPNIEVPSSLGVLSIIQSSVPHMSHAPWSLPEWWPG